MYRASLPNWIKRRKKQMLQKAPKEKKKKKPTGKTRSSTIGNMRKGHLCETRSSNGTNKPAHE